MTAVRSTNSRIVEFVRLGGETSLKRGKPIGPVFLRADHVVKIENGTTGTYDKDQPDHLRVTSSLLTTRHKETILVDGDPVTVARRLTQQDTE